MTRVTIDNDIPVGSTLTNYSDIYDEFDAEVERCPKCKGSGMDRDEIYECPVCGGEGEISLALRLDR